MIQADDGLKQWLQELETSSKSLRSWNFVTLCLLGVALGCTIYGCTAEDMSWVSVALALWLFVGATHLVLRSLYKEERKAIVAIQTGAYQIKVLECIGVQQINGNHNYFFDVTESGKTYHVMGTEKLANCLLPIFDIPNHAPVYVSVIFVRGWLHVIGRYLPNEKHS